MIANDIHIDFILAEKESDSQILPWTPVTVLNVDRYIDSLISYPRVIAAGYQVISNGKTWNCHVPGPLQAEEILVEDPVMSISFLESALALSKNKTEVSFSFWSHSNVTIRETPPGFLSVTENTTEERITPYFHVLHVSKTEWLREICLASQKAIKFFERICSNEKLKSAAASDNILYQSVQQINQNHWKQLLNELGHCDEFKKTKNN